MFCELLYVYIFIHLILQASTELGGQIGFWAPGSHPPAEPGDRCQVSAPARHIRSPAVSSGLQCQCYWLSGANSLCPACLCPTADRETEGEGVSACGQSSRYASGRNGETTFESGKQVRALRLISKPITFRITNFWTFCEDFKIILYYLYILICNLPIFN